MTRSLSPIIDRRRARDHARRAASGELLEDVRRLLLPVERARIERLEQEPLTGEEVGAALAEAIDWAEERRPEPIRRALSAPVTRALRGLATEKPEILADLLAPTITSAVLKAVRAAIEKLSQRFDHALAQSLSIEGLRWRMESRRTGMPLAEVVLLRTLVYRVEEVFLLHAETGLVLQHVAQGDVDPRGPDQVAALLSAIESFAGEAFDAGEGGLRHVAVGDVTLWLDRGPLSTVVAVVRGEASRELDEVLAGAHDRIRAGFSAALASFRGDPSPLAGARSELEACLLERRISPPRRAGRWVAILTFVAVALLALVAVRWVAARAKVAAATEALREVPGIVVLRVESAPRGGVAVEGLRDPLAEDAAAAVARRGVALEHARFAPYISLEPEIAARRARGVLDPPAGVTLALEHGALAVHGRAPRAWIARAALLSPGLVPGIDRIDMTAVASEEGPAELAAAEEAMRGVHLDFAVGQSTFRTAEGPALEAALQAFRAGQQAALETKQSLCLVITGHADARGGAEINDALKRARATRVVGALTERGIPAARTTVDVHSGASERAVTLRLEARPAGADCRRGTP